MGFDRDEGDAVVRSIPTGTASSIREPAASETQLMRCGNRSYGGQVRPREWDGGCTGDQDLLRMSWSRWDADMAVGEGLTGYRDCAESCADGGYYRFASTATASRARVCKDRDGEYRRFFTRVRITYRVPEGHPSRLDAGEHDRTLKIICET
jgi:hypothetical protein